MAHPVANTFAQAADLIGREDRRQGNCLNFSAGDQIICTGDIHGHRRNLAKVVGFADLGAHPDRRLILQELLHGGPTDTAGGDRSIELLLRGARLKITYPDRVFFLMGNHDLAQFTGNEITKAGVGQCAAFDAGLAHSFGADAAEVRRAAGEFLRSLPLAAKCENGLFISHSLPGPARTGMMDWDILDREYQPNDLRRGGSVYELLWGRGHTPEQLAELSDKLNVRYFLLGHEPVPNGFKILHDRAVIIASDDSHGAVAVFDAGAELSPEELPGLVRPIAAL